MCLDSAQVKDGLCSFGMLRDVGWCVVTDVSRQPVGIHLQELRGP